MISPSNTSGPPGINVDGIFARVRDGGVVIDVKSALRVKPPRGIRLWSL